MVLSSAEREERARELQAKRQKLEEEKRRILQQAQEDRKTFTDDFVPATQKVSQEPPEPVRKPPAASVRLQVRCRDFAQVLQLTCFTPESSLDDVRRTVREEILSRVDATLVARVPPLEDFSLVETVPPRRRFKSETEVMQSLREVGLLGNVALTAEAPPLPAPEPPAPEPSYNAPMAQDASDNEDDDVDDAAEPGQVGGPAVPVNSDDDYRDDDDASGSDDSSNDDSYNGPPQGLPGPFPGFGRPPQGNARRLPPGSRSGRVAKPGEHLFPEGGGQVLGSRPEGAAETAVGGQGVVAASEQMRQQREARLAALEKRGCATGSAPEQQADVLQSSKQTAASSSSAAQPTLQPRVPGVMGGGVNKMSRAKEREEILRQMEEDRATYKERHTAPAATDVTLELQSVERGGKSLCFTKIGSRGFSSNDALSRVRDLAAEELGQEVGMVSLAMLSTPQVEFSSAQLTQTLGQLKICTGDQLVAVTRAAEAPASSQPEEAVGPACIPCPDGHDMPLVRAEEEGWCDKCKESLPAQSGRYSCQQCDIVLCPTCASSL
mmetsp:Transcript_31557/g.57999  ORF Transcript_31557/g.57999 Transcript_31557/m.57999 type:complete len:551 (-) Transcript_31557:137-1789(-)